MRLFLDPKGTKEYVFEAEGDGYTRTIRAAGWQEGDPVVDESGAPIVHVDTMTTEEFDEFITLITEKLGYIEQ